MPIVARLKPDHFWTDWRGHGASSAELEADLKRRLSQITGTSHVVLFPYGRTALHWFCKEELKGTREVLVPAYDCAVVPDAIALAGAHPRWIEVRAADGNLDPDHLARLASRSKAECLVATHLFGNTCDLDACEEIQRRSGIRYLFTDAALALFSYHRGRHVASFGDAGLLSFSVGKHVSFLNGGALVTNDPNLFARAQAFADRISGTGPLAALKKWLMYGSVLMTYEMGLYPLAHYLYHSTPLLDFLTTGIKSNRIELPSDLLSRLTRLQLVLGQAQMSRLDASLDRRREIQREYQKHFSGISLVNSSFEHNVLSHYCIRLPDRKRFLDSARREGVYLDGGLFDYALPDLPQFARFGEGSYPVARQLGEEVVNLPMYPTLAASDQNRVIELVSSHLASVATRGGSAHAGAL